MANYTPTTPRSASEMRAELDKVAAAIQTVLHRDNTTPNQMNADFDMNNFQILNARVGEYRLSEIAQAGSDAIQAAEDAQASADAAAQSAVEAEASADSAEAAAALVNGIVSLPVLAWVETTVVTNPTQRYQFGNILYIAPSASVSNPIVQGATPVGDSNWVDWSTPNYYYAYEETVASDKSVFTLSLGFFEISEVFWENTFLPPSNYSIDVGAKTVTFNEPIPAGTYIRIWAGKDKNDVIQDYEDALAQAVPIQYDAGVIASPTDVFRPNEAFDTATLFVDGVSQREGASYAFIVEVDSMDSNFNQIRFSENLPAGAQLYGELRSL